METLERLEAEYKKFTLWGYNSFEAAENATENVFKDITVPPHIHKNSYGEASHLFYQNYVIFFGYGIYKSLK